MDQLLYIPRSLACPANPAGPGCLPGGYGAPLVLDDKVDGVSLLTDVKVVSGVGSFGTGAKYGPGDVLVLAERPARILVYAKADISAYLANPTGTKPVPKIVTSDFDCEEPESFGIFATGELLVATARGRVLVFGADGARQAAPFADLHDEAVGLAVGVEGGAGADPVSGGRVLVTLRRDNRLVSLGVTRNGSDLLAPLGGPAHSLLTNLAGYGVGDASVSGSVYAPASDGPLVVDLTSHEITFEKLNTAGFLEGNYYVVPEATVRSAKTCDCPEGSLTLEGITRCVPWYARGYALNSTCLNDGTGNGCYYLVFSADTGANLFGGTQEHHFEEYAFGFPRPATRTPAPRRIRSSRAPSGPRTRTTRWWSRATTSPTSRPAAAATSGAADSSRCSSPAGTRARSRDIVSAKLENLERALNGCERGPGRARQLYRPGPARLLEEEGHARLLPGQGRGRLAAPERRGHRVRARLLPGPDSRQPERSSRSSPGGLPAATRRASSSRAPSPTWFLACGAAESCQRRLTP